VSGSSPLDRARERAAELRAAGEYKRLTPVERAQKSPRSLRMAITARCYQCEGEGADAGWRDRIAACNATTCALHPVRPYQDRAEDDEAEVTS
jgi:hypothetical protein